MMPKNLNKIYMLVVMVLAVAILALAVFTYGIFEAIRQAAVQITQAKSETANMQVQDEAITDFKLQYGQYQENLEKVGQAFVDSANPVNFIRFLEGAADKAGVSLEVAIIPRSGNAAATTAVSQNMAFGVYAYGDFAQMLRFSQALESGPYVVKITNVTIKNREKNAGENAVPAGQVEAYLLVEALPK